MLRMFRFQDNSRNHYQNMLQSLGCMNFMYPKAILKKSHPVIGTFFLYLQYEFTISLTFASDSEGPQADTIVLFVREFIIAKIRVRFICLKISNK